MKTNILILAVGVIMALSVILTQPLAHHTMMAYAVYDPNNQKDPRQMVSQNPDLYELDQNGQLMYKDTYTVMLKDEAFTSVDDNPKFLDKDKVKFSNIPEKNAEVVPALLHEYTMETSEILNEKVEQYNGSDSSSSSPSPLERQGGKIDMVYMHALRGFTVRGVDDISIFAGDPDIATVEQDPVMFKHFQYIPFNIPRTELTKALDTSLRPDGREGFPNIDVAVLDGGVLPTHPDLNVFSVVTLPAASGYTPGPDEHGTHVAGTVAARDNLGGVVGVIPGARIWSYPACGSGNQESCPFALAGLNYVTANAASLEVANLSLGGGDISEASTTAMNNAVNAGVTVVVSAGNEAENANELRFCGITSSLCVSALADYDGLCGGVGGNEDFPDDVRADFSNFGSDVDLMAPGELILSTWLPTSGWSNTHFPFIGTSSHGGYFTISGTSMASPFVAGAAAIVKMKNPSFTPAQVDADLTAKAIDQSLDCDGANRGGLEENANDASSEKIVNLRDY